MSAFSQVPYYQGKTITVIAGRDAGGEGDIRVRALIPFLRKYIPGQPAIVMQYMPGAGGRKAANYIYQSARPDGLSIGNITSGFVSSAILGESGVNYDVDKFIYLGSGHSQVNNVFHTRKDFGLDSLAKLRSASGLRIGAQSVGHVTYILVRLFAWLLDLKDPKFITGYSTPEIDLAMNRGELDARSSVVEAVPKQYRAWIEKDLMNWHVIFETPRGYRFRHAAFDPVPTTDDLVRSEREKRVPDIIRGFRAIGVPYILPPNTPKELAETVREAFRKTFKDPAFLRSWTELTGEDPSPLTPEEQSKAVSNIPRDEETIDLFKKIAGGGPLPPR
jgi:tripartite-type tricarboxylate transporter receptor subunit TctC